MVTVAKPLITSYPGVGVPETRHSTNGTVAAGRGACPRCEAQLRINYFEPQCLQCGYVDYTYRSPNGAKKSVVNSGTRYVLRYVGDFPALGKVLAHIQLQRLRNRVVYGVSCPFCSQSMMQTSLSGKRREVREERYKCMEGHRVSLTPNRDGGLGWK